MGLGRYRDNHRSRDDHRKVSGRDDLIGGLGMLAVGCIIAQIQVLTLVIEIYNTDDFKERLLVNTSS
jgi:hypothetical protein